jgi:uncharacterized protein YeaO (DUF488 family)
VASWNFQKKAKVKIWMKDIAPSYDLIREFHNVGSWIEFKNKYKKELKQKSVLIKEIKELEKSYKIITLVYSAKDEKKNQAVILKEILAK